MRRERIMRAGAADYFETIAESLRTPGKAKYFSTHQRVRDVLAAGAE
jgi:hypothetical protein